MLEKRRRKLIVSAETFQKKKGNSGRLQTRKKKSRTASRARGSSIKKEGPFRRRGKNNPLDGTSKKKRYSSGLPAAKGKGGKNQLTNAGWGEQGISDGGKKKGYGFRGNRVLKLVKKTPLYQGGKRGVGKTHGGMWPCYEGRREET